MTRFTTNSKFNASRVEIFFIVKFEEVINLFYGMIIFNKISVVMELIQIDFNIIFSKKIEWLDKKKIHPGTKNKSLTHA